MELRDWLRSSRRITGPELQRLGNVNLDEACSCLSVATPAERHGEDINCFMHILGGEQIFEKVPVKYFEVPGEGLTTLRTCFGSFFLGNSKSDWGSFALQTCHPNLITCVASFLPL